MVQRGASGRKTTNLVPSAVQRGASGLEPTNPDRETTNLGPGISESGPGNQRIWPGMFRKADADVPTVRLSLQCGVQEGRVADVPEGLQTEGTGPCDQPGVDPVGMVSRSESPGTLEVGFVLRSGRTYMAVDLQSPIGDKLIAVLPDGQRLLPPLVVTGQLRQPEPFRDPVQSIGIHVVVLYGDRGAPESVVAVFREIIPFRIDLVIVPHPG